jgi:hypothetical protein
MSAGLKHSREFGMALYGRATLAEVQGEPMKPGVDLNQLPGDLRVMHDSLQKLLAEVKEKESHKEFPLSSSSGLPYRIEEDPSGAQYAIAEDGTSWLYRSPGSSLHYPDPDHPGFYDE